MELQLRLATTYGKAILSAYYQEKQKISWPTLYKKEKNIFYKNTIVFFTDYYLKKIQLSKNLDNNQILTNRSLILENINDFFLYNFNQDTLVRSIESRILNE